jgi:hypothetical protein
MIFLKSTRASAASDIYLTICWRIKPDSTLACLYIVINVHSNILTSMSTLPLHVVVWEDWRLIKAAKVARHVRITIISWDYVGNVTIPTQVIKHSHFYPSRRISQPDCSIHIKLIYIGIHFRITSFRTKLDNYIIKSKSTCTTFSLYLIAFISRQSSQTTTCSGNVDMDVNILLCTLMTITRASAASDIYLTIWFFSKVQ